MIKLELPKPSCYHKETAFDWDICHKCQYCGDCDYNANGYDDIEDDYFLLYY